MQWYPFVHGCVVVRDPAGVRALICAAQEDQDVSRYSVHKAVVQHEMLGWHAGHGDLPPPGVLRGTGWVAEGGGSTLRRKHSKKHSPASNDVIHFPDAWTRGAHCFLKYP